jgi:hypothetical protein
MTRRFLWFLGGLILSVGNARAHPVAQGAMDIVVWTDRIEVKARVFNEEALLPKRSVRRVTRMLLCKQSGSDMANTC